jgi:hypothetical protein
MMICLFVTSISRQTLKKGEIEFPLLEVMDYRN